MSQALVTWETKQVRRLDQLLMAHRKVGGDKPGRRYATSQLNHALIVAIAAEFQAFCRNLHSESVSALAKSITDADLRSVVHAGMTSNRMLDRYSARYENVAKDFERIGVDIWGAAKARHRTTKKRIKHLEQLMDWRNAIAHQDFSSEKLKGRTEARLRDAKQWRGACTGLAKTFDAVLAEYLEELTGQPPWE